MANALAGGCVEQSDTQPSAAFILQPLHFVDKPLFQYRSRTGCATHDDEAGQTRTRRAQQLSSADHLEASLCVAAPRLTEAGAATAP
jgi:hypothetical protein